jgi:hypothetical protein
MIATLLLATCALAQNPPSPNPSAEVAKAFALAKAENRRVLLIQEDADPAVNTALSALLKSSKIGRELMYEYAKVTVASDSETAKPALLQIFRAEGAVLASLPEAELRNQAGELDAAILLQFLQTHEAEPWDALEVLKTARLEAVKTNKRLFVHLGAPW